MLNTYCFSKPLVVSLFLIFAFLPGCAKSNPVDKNIIAYVNNEPIYATDLARELTLKARQDPTFKITHQAEADQLQNIINSKLVIQKAMEKGLAREDRFVNTIKAYWEQTLIRDFIEYKQREFKNYVFASEAEIKNYYDKLPNKDTLGTLDTLRPEIAKRIAEEKEAKLFEDWLKSERAKARISILK